MRIRTLVFLGMLLVVGGCSESVITATSGNLTQSQIDEIIAKCKAPSEMVTLSDGKIKIVIENRTDESLALFNCLFDALDATGETDLRGGGSERNDTAKPDKAGGSN